MSGRVKAKLMVQRTGFRIVSADESGEYCDDVVYEKKRQGRTHSAEDVCNIPASGQRQTVDVTKRRSSRALSATSREEAVVRMSTWRDVSGR